MASGRAAGYPLAGRILRRAPLGVAALVLIAAFMVVAALAPQLSPHDPLAHDLDHRLVPPGTEFLLGTDNFGRDVLSRILHGARVTILVGLVSVALATISGTVIGMTSALVGGRLDLLGQRVADSFSAFPALVMVLILVAAFGPSAQLLIAGIAVAYTPQIARLARAESLRAKEEGYVTAARAAGAPRWRILVRHVMPDIMPPVVVLATGYVGEAMVLEAGLSFLGVGVPPPEPSWGRMIFEGAHQYLETAPWLTIYPGIALSLVVLSFALLGDSLRDVLDRSPATVPPDRGRAADLPGSPDANSSGPGGR